jgi:cephalosporin hydroxylase
VKTEQQVTTEVHAIAREFSMKRQKPLIAILQPRRNLKETPAQQLMSWKNRMVNVTSIAVSYHAIDGNPVDSARCYLMDKALEDDAKYALFIDEDTALPWDGVSKMMDVSNQYPDAIITGIYYVKFGNVMTSVKDSEGRWTAPDVSPSAPIIRNIMSTGLGCALIPLHLIKRIQAQFEKIPLFCIVPENTWRDKDVTFIGEDTWFYNLVSKCGIEVIGVPSVQCLHMELATGKYMAHPDVKLTDYLTNMPPTTTLTLDDMRRVSKDYLDRICKPEDTSLAVNGIYKPVVNLPIDYTKETEARVVKCLKEMNTTQNYYEVARLCERINSLKPNTVLEIGVESGGSMNLWAEFSASDAMCIGVDMDRKIEGLQYKNRSQKFNFIIGDSHKIETVEKVKALLGDKKVDFLFIDGDHSEQGVSVDFEKYLPLVRTGGIIAFHDINTSENKEICEGVKKTWNNLKSAHKTEEFVNTEADICFGIGMIVKE